MKYKSITPEGILTRQIRGLLKTIGVFHWKVHQGLGSEPGVSDILGIYQGKFLAIEVKAPKGKVSEAQEAFINKVNAEGGLAFVAWSLEDVIKALGIGDRIFFQGRY